MKLLYKRRKVDTLKLSNIDINDKYKEASSVLTNLNSENESLKSSKAEADAKNQELYEKVTELTQKLQSSDDLCQVWVKTKLEKVEYNYKIEELEKRVIKLQTGKSA